MTTNIALIILWITIMGLFFTIYKLLIVNQNLAKLIKANNLQEYVIWDEIQNEKIDVWEDKERYADVWSINDEDLRNLNLNPENIYRGNIWNNIKEEKFT